MATNFATIGYVCADGPSSLMKSVPCLPCLSVHEMLAALVGIMALAAGKTVPQVMESSKCWKCLNEKQILQAVVTIFGNQLLGARHTPADVAALTNCLKCVSDKELLAALSQLLCAEVTLTPTSLPPT